MKKLKVEYVSIDSITPSGRNAKLHPAEQIEQIKKSITDYGMCDPIGVWHDEIVEGHGRFIACKKLGIDKVPIIRLDDLTDEQRREYMLVHNKTTMNSDFDVDILQMELEDLPDFDAEFYDFDVEFEQEENEPTEAKYNETISVVIDCTNEEEAEKIFNELTEEGYECRISTL